MLEDTDRQILRAAEVLKAAGAREVYLFGSAASGRLREGSDIDFAVAGLAPDMFFRAMGQATRETTRPLDIVDLDERTPFTEYLRKKGRMRRVA